MTNKERAAETEALQDLGIVPESSVVFPGGELRKFDNLIGRRAELKAALREYETEVKEVDAKLTEMLTAHDTVKVKHSGYSVTLAQGSSSSLSKDRLLELGVAATTIAAATVVKSYSYLLVSAPKPSR